MAKKGGTQTVSNTLDPATQEQVRRLFEATNRASTVPGQGIDPASAAAGGFYGGATRTGNLGLSALSGDPAARASFLNPYNDEVINRIIADQGRLNEGTLSAVGDQATEAGAFGGSRHGVAEGVALADINRSAADRIAELRSQGFTDAMSRAGAAANIGFGGAQGAFNYGDYARGIAEQNDPARRQMAILREGLQGIPYGTTQSQPMTSGGGARGFLGGAATLGGLAKTLGASSPWGWAGAGGLLGLFG